MCDYGEQRSALDAIPQALSILVFEIESLVGLELTLSSRLSDK